MLSFSPRALLRLSSLDAPFSETIWCRKMTLLFVCYRSNGYTLSN
jgi:hypothetical protein